MKLVCLDMENVLWPEVWPAVAEVVGVPELAKTTRDFKDTNELYAMRSKYMKANNITLTRVLEVIEGMEPMDGAVEFLNELKTFAQFVVLSDTFTQFTPPMRKKLGWPTIICNELEVDGDDMIVGWKMRCDQTKLSTVKAFQSVGIETICSGDSYNDLGMIQASKHGFLYNTTIEIKRDYPDIPTCETYAELLDCLRKAWEE